ncbi:MAG: hypothetical protein KJO61_11865, partial [Deltaproteobacteria bacterium]|nr:hypothetical protein [Deltaproteobacteria bacterium]
THGAGTYFRPPPTGQKMAGLLSAWWSVGAVGIREIECTAMSAHRRKSHNTNRTENDYQGII